jgi:hypothetical protein
MRPDLIASLIGMPHDQRYWTYLIGLAIFGLMYLVQRPRMPKRRYRSGSGRLIRPENLGF